MIPKQCARCGADFHAKFPSQKLCYECWLMRERAFEDNERLTERIRDLEREMTTLRNRPEAAPIPDEIYPLLRILCHPDRHSNSTAATKATIWLNDCRKKARG